MENASITNRKRGADGETRVVASGNVTTAQCGHSDYFAFILALVRVIETALLLW